MKNTLPIALGLGLIASSLCTPASAFVLGKKTTTPQASQPEKSASLLRTLGTDKGNTAKPAAEPKAAPTAVQKAVAKLNTISGSVNPNADYYIYLQSASWCGPCQAEMPEIAKEYRAMKSGGKVELILISWDQTPAKAKAFAQSHGATFPVVMNTDRSVAQLPGFKKANGIPNATIVDKNGKQIINGHGSLIMDWKTFCKNR